MLHASVGAAAFSVLVCTVPDSPKVARPVALNPPALDAVQ